MEIGLNTRKEILARALFFENMTSIFLARLIGISDLTNSKVLGNKGGCLSFNQKVDILIEIGAISATDRKKFQAFMEIRNQFMHNLAASNFEKCFSFMNGTDKFLLKTYPQDLKKSRENQLKEATFKLGDDIGHITALIIKEIEKRNYVDYEHKVTDNSNEAFLKSISQVKEKLDDVFNKEIEKSPTFDSERLRNFGTQISSILFGLWRKNFDEISNAEKIV